MNEELMTNTNEVVEAAEEIVESGCGCGTKTLIGFGVGLVAGVLVCKVGKPLVEKIKNRKAAKMDEYIKAEVDDFDFDYEEDLEVSEEKED